MDRNSAVILTLNGLLQFLALGKPQTARILWLDKALQSAKHPRVQELIQEAEDAKRILWRAPYEFNMCAFTEIMEKNGLNPVMGSCADAEAAMAIIRSANQIPIYL